MLHLEEAGRRRRRAGREVKAASVCYLAHSFQGLLYLRRLSMTMKGLVKLSAHSLSFLLSLSPSPNRSLCVSLTVTFSFSLPLPPSFLYLFISHTVFLTHSVCRPLRFISDLKTRGQTPLAYLWFSCQVNPALMERAYPVWINAVLSQARCSLIFRLKLRIAHVFFFYKAILMFLSKIALKNDFY